MIKKFVSRRWLKIGYEQRIEKWKMEGDKEFTTMKSAYSPNGDYIGDYKQARFLFNKKGIIQVFKSNKNNCVCSIGFNLIEQKWYGWSHRGICGFEIGNKIFEQNYGNDQTLFIKHGRQKIKTLADAKQAAINFADYVS